MDIRSLRYALTLAEELHFGRAAQAHFIGAQPFGRRIQELERELGTDLFLRTSRKVELTEAGRRFLPRANRVLADLDALMSVREGERAESVLRVGVLGFGLADNWSATRRWFITAQVMCLIYSKLTKAIDVLTVGLACLDHVYCIVQ